RGAARVRAPAVFRAERAVEDRSSHVDADAGAKRTELLLRAAHAKPEERARRDPARDLEGALHERQNEQRAREARMCDAPSHDRHHRERDDERERRTEREIEDGRSDHRFLILLSMASLSKRRSSLVSGSSSRSARIGRARSEGKSARRMRLNKPSATLFA